jgi:translation initiation factor IF-2
VLVQTGTLKVGEVVVVGETYGRIRALENSHGERVQEGGPSTPLVVLGLSEVPAAGDILRVVPDEKTARTMVEDRREASARPDGGGRATLDDLYRQIQAGQTKELRVIIKADVQGSLGAIRRALEQLQDARVRINILHEGAGDITDTDILLASASNAIVVGFNTKLDPQARRTAEAEGVDVRLYDIIYRLTEEMQAALTGMLEPELIEVVEGRAEVRQIFRVGRRAIAGSYVTDGRIVATCSRHRGGKVITSDRIESLRASATTCAGCYRFRMWHRARQPASSKGRIISASASRRYRASRGVTPKR